MICQVFFLRKVYRADVPRGTLFLAASQPRRLTYTDRICYNILVPIGTSAETGLYGRLFPSVRIRLGVSCYIVVTKYKRERRAIGMEILYVVLAIILSLVFAVIFAIISEIIKNINKK